MGGLQPWHWVVGALVAVFALATFILVVVVIVRLVSSSKPAPRVGQQPGWYADPHNPSLIRFFDGRQWTASVRSADKFTA